MLKTFGERPPAGLLSFPMPGTTLALDFPNRGAETLALFERSTPSFEAAGGRLYAAKDARMPAALFKRGYPQWQAFEAYRDPGHLVADGAPAVRPLMPMGRQAFTRPLAGSSATGRVS